MNELLHIGKKVLSYVRYPGFILLKPTTDDGDPLPLIAQSLLYEEYSFIEEVIATEREILVKWHGDFKEQFLIQMQELSINNSMTSKTWDIPVWFGDTHDWEFVTAHTKFTKEEYLDRLLKVDYTMRMYGFMPGFLYGTGLSHDLQCPRRANPRPRVRAGSIAVGGEYLGCYSLSSPGGWNILGHTPLIMHQVDWPLDFLPKIGDKLNFHNIDKEEYQRLLQMNLSLNEYDG